MRKIEEVFGDDGSKTRLQYLQASGLSGQREGVGVIRTLLP